MDKLNKDWTDGAAKGCLFFVGVAALIFFCLFGWAFIELVQWITSK